MDKRELLCIVGGNVNWYRHYGRYIDFPQIIKTTLSCCCVNHSVMSDSLRPHGLQPTRLLRPWDFSGKDTGVGCHVLLQGIFLTQGQNPGLLHCRRILYHMSTREAHIIQQFHFWKFHLKRTKTLTQKDTSTPIFIAALIEQPGIDRYNLSIY